MLKAKTKRLNSDYILYIGVLSLIGLTVLSGTVASSIRVNADDENTAVTTASVTVAASCSMTATIDIPHNATLANGIYSGGTEDYADGIGKTTIATFCNDNSGYAIYAIGYTGDSYTGEDHTKLVGQSVGEKIATGTATSGNTSNWAMKLTKVTDSAQSYNPANLSIENGYDDYNVIPDTYTKVANYTSTTDMTLGSVLSTTYAAYISGTQVADTYVGKVKYTLVHPNTEIPLHPETTTTGKIHYWPNGSAVVGTMGEQDVSSSVTLLASNYGRNGYGFAGWSDKFDYATNPEAKFYGPNETIALNTADYTGTNPGLSLYAVWVKSEGSLQDSDKVASVCSNLTTAPIDGTANLASVSALTDQRDDNTYAIAKLADGKCWMIENMRLDNTATGNSDGSLAQGYGGQFAGLASPESPWANNITTANSLYSTDGADDTINIGTSNAGYRFPRYNNVNTPTSTSDRPQNPTSNSATNNTSSASMYSYGNYYTWAAAIADITEYSSNNNSVTSTSICPAGWHLPKGGNKSNEANNEFWSLIVTGINGGTNPANYESSTQPNYTGTPEGSDASNKLRAYPNNFVYSGYVSSGSVSGRGSYGGYWSSTANDSNDAYNLYFSNSNVGPGTSYDYKYIGWTIRCVASGA